ncbi:MAG: UDP-N-acetylmuramoyl-L-alanine--D-glutamate ligase [bacterium]
MNVQNKNILVSGIGKSGVSASILLSKLGANVTIQDLNHLKNLKVIKLLNDYNIKLYTGQNPNYDLIDTMDMMVVSPGLPLDLDFVKYADSKIPVISEIELGFLNCNNDVPIIAITGTNGKTTTTSLVGSIFDKYKTKYNKTYIAGNIGLPFSEEILNLKCDDVAILELSSFQLETIDKFKPNVSCVLNISEDHLNRHKTMENYIKAKERIFKNQTNDDYLVLNYDDKICREMTTKTPAKILYFSLENNFNDGDFKNDFNAYLSNNIIYLNNIEFININSLKILGNHNMQNIMASILMCKAMGMPDNIIKKGLVEFEAVEHRIEFVDCINSVKYYNDSKGTNVDATIHAMNAMNSPTFIILGGSEKNADFTPIINNLKNNKFKKAILIGEVKNRIAKSLDDNKLYNYEIKESLLEAVTYCYENALEGDSVLLSPACASFDMFKNYEERGNLFKKYVRDSSELVGLKKIKKLKKA